MTGEGAVRGHDANVGAGDEDKVCRYIPASLDHAARLYSRMRPMVRSELRGL